MGAAPKAKEKVRHALLVQVLSLEKTRDEHGDM